MTNRRTSASHDRGLLVLAAWKPELTRLLQLMRSRRNSSVTTRTVGVGLVEAAAGAARAFSELAPRRAVLIGTAGVFAGSSYAPPRAVWAKDMVLGAEEGVDAELPAPMPRVATPGPRMGAQIARASGLAAARVVCPLAITRSARRARQLARASDAELENLESFAVARAAEQAKVPFAVVLGVANEVGPNGHAQWREHGDAAAAAACEAVWAWFTQGASGA